MEGGRQYGTQVQVCVGGRWSIDGCWRCPSRERPESCAQSKAFRFVKADVFLGREAVLPRAFAVLRISRSLRVFRVVQARAVTAVRVDDAVQRSPKIGQTID